MKLTTRQLAECRKKDKNVLTLILGASFLTLTAAALLMGGRNGPYLKVKRITCPSLGIDLHFDENGKEIAK